MKKNVLRIVMAALLLGFVYPAAMLAANLAATAIATTSSGSGELAIDGNLNTRWESNFEDPQWIQLQLDDTYTLSQISINWEGANAKVYTVDISEDGANWTTIHTENEGATGARTDLITLNNNAKYIKITGTERNLTYGYSIFEIEVAGSPIGGAGELTSIELSAPKLNLYTDEEVTITASGLDADGYSTAVSPVWSSNGGTINNGVFSSTLPGIYSITATDGAIFNSIEIIVTDPLITGITATASSGNADLAVDGDLNSRWESEALDPQWISLDLNSSYTVTSVAIHWEAANAKAYTLEVSDDGVVWQTEATVTDGAFGARTDRFVLDASARYVRLNGTERSSIYAYSIYEFEVFGINNTPTSNPEVATEEAPEIYAHNGQIILKNLALNHSNEIKIYNISGSLISIQKVNGDLMQIPVPNGAGQLCIVSVYGDKTVSKVLHP